MTRSLKTPQQKNQALLELKVRLTHPDRVIFAGSQVTKRDLALYYAAIAKWMLPHAAGRPLAIVRCPTGVGDTCFFQKHPPIGLSTAVKRIKIREKEKEDAYLEIDDVAGLVALVQHGVIEVHLWGARSDDVERPDRLVFDLDPGPAVPWKEIVLGAMRVRRDLNELGLASFVKTSGGKGLHVVVPVERRHEWPTVKAFCRDLAGKIAAGDPNRFTVNPLKAQRHGKIFVDYLRNERGATAVAPYSVRARSGGPVAMPVTWDELSRLHGSQQFTIANALARMKRLAVDPWEKMFEIRQSIEK
jgi:bifunctional non-homologous end joining protein LigD